MPARPDVRPPRLRHSEANGVADLARCNFVVTNQPRHNGKSRGVGGGPGVVPKGVGIQLEDCARTRFPTPVALRIGAENFIQHAVVAIQHQHVPVAFTLGPALDWRIRWNRVWSGIAFVRVLKTDRDSRLRTRHYDERNADGAALKCAGA